MPPRTPYRDADHWPWIDPRPQVFDERDNLFEVLGRLADLSVAQAAYEAAVAKH